MSELFRCQPGDMRIKHVDGRDRKLDDGFDFARAFCGFVEKADEMIRCDECLFKSLSHEVARISSEMQAPRSSPHGDPGHENRAASEDIEAHIWVQRETRGYVVVNDCDDGLVVILRKRLKVKNLLVGL